MTEAMKRPKFVRWAVMLGIVIALNLFFFAGRSMLLPEPKYEDYCQTRTAPAATESECVKQDGVWVATTPDANAPKTAPQAVNGYCDLYQKCQPLYDAARKNFELHAFVVMVGLGVLSLIAGVLPIGSSIVSSGLSYGGVLALLIAAAQYWNDAATWVQLLMSAVALGALLYIGIRRFKD